MDKKVNIKIFDQYNNPMIGIKLEKVNEYKIEPILKSVFMINAFDEGWFNMFKEQLKEKFLKIGALGIQIERLNLYESNQDSPNIHSWEIEDKGESLLNKYLD